MMGRRQGGEAGVAETYTFQGRSRFTRLLSETMAAGLMDGGLTRLMVSLDAVTQPVYDKIRVGADLEVVKRNVFRFLELRQARGRRLPLLSVNFVKMSVNEHELEKFVETW